MTYGQATRKKIRIPDLLQKKGQAKISALTCYDAVFARLLEQTNVDVVLVGDSLGHVIQGLDSTIPVTLEDMCYHVRCVAKKLHTPLLVADVPFACAGWEKTQTMKSVEALMRAGAEAVKIEGASYEILEDISRLTRNGVPVMGHLGLTPQSVHALGGYKIQGKDDADKQRLLTQAQQLQEAGCFVVVFELVTSDTATEITRELQIPTIGIGSGPNCDGQILVLHDMLGMNKDFHPKFLKHFAQLEDSVIQAVNTYCSEVNDTLFPLK